jgi:hypothetical protein
MAEANPGSGAPTCSGVIRARRLARNSAMSLVASTESNIPRWVKWMGARGVTAGDRPDPGVEPTDAVVRDVPACVCGPDLAKL